MKQAGIIGGAGFIGSHVTKKFLEEGFNVKVSATDPSRKDKYMHLSALKNAANIELVKLDVENKEALRKFVAGCSVIVHGGTPFQLDVKDPQKELFDPTIKGTENFLAVIRETPGIEKVVFIASVAAYNANFPLPPHGKTDIDTIDEDDVKFNSEQSHPYGQAKFIANQTVEKFISDNPGLDFEISSVSPVFVMGASLSNRDDSTSGGMQFLFKNKIAPNPFVQMIYDNDVAFAGVDVSDVADCVYKAAVTRGLHGRNYLLSSESYRVSDIHLMLNGAEPLRPPFIIYKNDLAKRELNARFITVKEALSNYAKQ